MTKDQQNIQNCLAAINEARTRSANRFGLHLRISGLERMFRDSGFRRLVGQALQPLVKAHGSKMFPLTNADMLIVTGTPPLDVIDKCLREVRTCYKGSKVVDAIDAKPGVSDALVTWYPLDSKLDEFEKLVKTLESLLCVADEPPAPQSADIPFAKVPEGVVPQAPPAGAAPKGPSKPAPAKKVRLPGDEEEAELTGRADPSAHMDMDRFASVGRQLAGADLSGLMERTDVMALTPQAPPVPVMVHREVPFEKVTETFLGRRDMVVDPWLRGYVEDLVSDRLLSSHPDVGDESSIASSLRATISTILSPTFEQFDRSLGERPRKRVILEMSVFDAFVDPGRFVAALERVKERGFRTQIAGLDARAFLWVTTSAFDVNFIKLKASQVAYEHWLKPTEGEAVAFRQAVKAFGPQRVILDGCSKPGYVTAAQKLGLYLFSGSAVGA